jgi:hypothetical protein
MRVWPWVTPKQDDKESGMGAHKISEETTRLLENALEQCKARCVDAVESGQSPFTHLQRLRIIVENSGNCLSTALRNKYLNAIEELTAELDEMRLRTKLAEYAAGVYPNPLPVQTSPQQAMKALEAAKAMQNLGTQMFGRFV